MQLWNKERENTHSSSSLNSIPSSSSWDERLRLADLGREDFFFAAALLASKTVLRPGRRFGDRETEKEREGRGGAGGRGGEVSCACRTN